MSSRFRRFAPALLTLLMAIAPCFGQGGRGGISGLITDQTAGVIPGSKTGTHEPRHGRAAGIRDHAAGLYSFAALVPGAYRLSATFSGFQKAIRESILVETDRVTEVNLQLQPGEVTETVTVTGESVLANTTNSTIGQLITSNTLESMPMNGRNVFLLVQLTPGVVPINGALNQTGATQRPGVEVSAFRINGQQAGSVAYMLDGSPLTVLGYGAAASSPAFTPALDAVQEYRMENSNLQASVNSPGTGVISVVSKSGTDRYHGSGFYFARPNAMAANDPFNKAAQALSGTANNAPRLPPLPVRRQHRRPHPPRQAVLLRPLRTDRNAVARHPHHDRPDGRRKGGQLLRRPHHLGSVQRERAPATGSPSRATSSPKTCTTPWR